MLETILDEVPVSIPCPHCNESFEKSLSWLKRNRKHWCPHCHEEIDLNTERFRSGVKRIDKAIKELELAILELEVSDKD